MSDQKKQQRQTKETSKKQNTRKPSQERKSQSSERKPSQERKKSSSRVDIKKKSDKKKMQQLEAELLNEGNESLNIPKVAQELGIKTKTSEQQVSKYYLTESQLKDVLTLAIKMSKKRNRTKREWTDDERLKHKENMAKVRSYKKSTSA